MTSNDRGYKVRGLNHLVTSLSRDLIDGLLKCVFWTKIWLQAASSIFTCSAKRKVALLDYLHKHQVLSLSLDMVDPEDPTELGGVSGFPPDVFLCQDLDQVQMGGNFIIIQAQLLKGSNQRVVELGGGNSNIFYFHPETWGRFSPILTSIFFKGVNQWRYKVPTYQLLGVLFTIKFVARLRAFFSEQFEVRDGKSSLLFVWILQRLGPLRKNSSFF